MHSKKTDLLALSLLLIFFIVFEETFGSGYNLILIDTPKVLQIINNVCLFVQRFENLEVRNKIQTQNTIADSCRFENFDPSNLVGVVTMSTAASFDINPFDIHNSNSVTWNNTPLVQVKTEFRLCFLFAFKVLTNWVSFQDDLVSFVLNLHLNLFGQGSVMSDVQMSVVFSFFSTVLPNMRT